MTYSTGGLIQASDYNTFNGAQTANVSGTLASVLSTGRGNAGYGQSMVANVSAAGTVTATQWTTLVNAINTVRKHQSGGSFSNIGTYTAGTTINATNDVAGNLTAAYNNRLTYTAQGSTTTGTTYSPNFTLPNQLAGTTYQMIRTVTFASADQARYFFNAGGQINFVVISVTNNDGTTRSASLATLAQTNFASKKFGAADFAARTGTGGTATDSTTGAGYYSFTTSDVSKCRIVGGTAAYTSDTIELFAKSNGTQGSNADAGSVVTLTLNLTTATQTGGFNDSVNITVNYRVDIIYPSSTYLTNSWGTVTIS